MWRNVSPANARGEPDIESSAPRAARSAATWRSFSGWPELPEGLDAPNRATGYARHERHRCLSTAHA